MSETNDVNAVVSCEPAREVWVVSNNAEGPSFVAQYKQGACDHASLMAGDFPEFSPWQVTHYIAAPFVAARFIEVHGEDFACKFIRELEDLL